MEGLWIPVQYNHRNIHATIIIHNTQEAKDGIEELMCKMMGLKKTTGKTTMAEAMTQEEAVAYNEGYEAALASVLPNTRKICAPEIEINGEKLLSQPKKRKNTDK